MTDEKFYLLQVEKTLEKLRARCMGQDTQLLSLLPPHAKEKDTRYQAQYLAAQLQFALLHAEGSYVDTRELLRCRKWLEELICYLLEEISEEDRTFYHLVQLITMPKKVRAIALHSFLPAGSELRTADPPDQLRKNLDTAIWWLLGTQGKQKRATELHQILQDLNLLAEKDIQ